MRLLTEDAHVVCRHETGTVKLLVATQGLVTIHGRKVLVHGDPLFKPIAGCANLGPTIKPCTLTISVAQGYSDLVTINGRAVCMETLTGVTDGTPPATVEYHVRQPGQSLVNTQE
ncbi:MAG: hypothetical protein KDE53_22095 [Caldilineaceae bacterium]|nr:hypothetical protein [Caldilineaceae bacterium]MCB0126581.1 hypothetical protein [Caldilineaceae bacterium]MCB0183758.1 hypothetical protein [Caldilineaceae bacterium]